MDLSYALTPFLAWFIAGVTKFIINSIKTRQWAFGLIGYGGLPSNHSAIVSSIVTLIAIKDGIDDPAFGVAVAFALIVMLDANSLRRQVGKHAKYINHLVVTSSRTDELLRERIGHTVIEIAAGIVIGIAVALSAAVAFN